MIDNFDGPYRYLSNFYPDSEDTNEHLFQAMKSTNWREQIVVLSAKTPGDAKRLGKLVTLRPDWDEIKDDVMLELLRLKFRKGTDGLHEALLGTEDEELIEGNYWHDQYWGDCRCARHRNTLGKNMLGKLLMKVRDELKEN